MNKQQMLELLRKDVVPALGCTEPVCVALCAANAGRLMKDTIKSIEVTTNAGVYKNGMSAGIPNCTKVGLVWAAAIGVYLKNPERSLELFADITPEILQSAETLIMQEKVSVTMDEAAKGLLVKCILRSESEEAICIIQNAHTNFVYLKYNDEVLLEKEVVSNQAGEDEIVNALTKMSIAEIRALVTTATEDELEFMLDGVTMNENLAAYSKNNPVGVGIGQNLRKEFDAGLLANDLASKIVLQVSAAAECRLDGCPLPTMSSSGSGTKGVVVILPVSETAKAIGASKLQTVQALAFAHLVNRYINAYVGKLSPMCSCVMCSSTAASASIAWLLGANDEQIGYAIRNMCGVVTGMICDGGKVGCAIKVSTGSFAALMSAIHAVKDVTLRTSDGICAETPEQCIKNIARIGNEGMMETDKVILDIMVSK